MRPVSPVMTNVTVHYNRLTNSPNVDAACRSAAEGSKFTNDRRQVTCEKCKNSRAWKDSK